MVEIAQADFVSVQGLRVTYGPAVALDGLDLEIARGEMFVLLGGSGSGKTTLLRALAGFVRPQAGRIVLDRRDITALPPHRRPVNTTFQSYALFPHLSVADNIAFGLRRQGRPRAEIAARVAELLALVRMEDLAARKPDALSGGQRQRVALARALAPGPQLLLLDEPLSALDRGLREQTRQELLGVQRRTGTTFVLVTHDQDEALAIATRIGLLHGGRLIQVGTPEALYERPASRYAAEFMGISNIFPATAHGTVLDVPGLGQVQTATPAHGSVHLALRPERLSLGAQGGPNRMQGQLTATTYRGGAVDHEVSGSSGAVLRVTVPFGASPGTAAQPGGSLVVSWRPDACVVLAGCER